MEVEVEEAALAAAAAAVGFEVPAQGHWRDWSYQILLLFPKPILRSLPPKPVSLYRHHLLTG